MLMSFLRPSGLSMHALWSWVNQKPYSWILDEMSPADVLSLLLSKLPHVSAVLIVRCTLI